MIRCCRILENNAVMHNALREFIAEKEQVKRRLVKREGRNAQREVEEEQPVSQKRQSEEYGYRRQSGHRCRKAMVITSG
ncbi:unnamed protein product [Litomosoides sigmodontis]|uniref:Uncharacterized protein n=1 Tax=Litomosoides sigmodontis TaxID=42156 RepID=A0A3P7JPP7_LITSI|nr:unnamed protein product [Litomosoides sigmodontis]